MKKTITILMAFLFLFSYVTPVFATGEVEATTEHPKTTEYPDDPGREPDLVGNCAFVMDAATGQILYEKNADDKKYPASITKIMTILVALDHNIDFNDTITMSENAIWGIDRNSSHIAVDVGERISVEDCVHAIMLESANECSYALAEYVAGDLNSFVTLMNEKAKSLGCTNTHFTNANGLQDENHYTTAHDMALITKAALEYDTFRTLAGTLSYTIPSTNLTEDTRPLWQGNKMINPAEPYYYEFCEGGKTGYTTDANNTLVTFAKKDELELICVILDCDGFAYCYSDSKALYRYCYNNYTRFYPLSDFSFESEDPSSIDTNTILENYYTSLDHDLVDLQIDRSYSLLISKSLDTTKIEQNIILYDKIKDDVLGEITFTYEGEQIGETPITTTAPLLSSKIIHDTEEEASSSVLKTIKKIALYIFILIAALVLLLLLHRLFSACIRASKRRRRRRSYRRRRRRQKDDYYF